MSRGMGVATPRRLPLAHKRSTRHFMGSDLNLVISHSCSDRGDISMMVIVMIT